jgi:hypothetical protein
MDTDRFREDHALKRLERHLVCELHELAAACEEPADIDLV